MYKLMLVALLLLNGYYTAFTQTPYLPTPANWTEETFDFPIEFAPNIPFQGNEHVRFTGGWGNGESEELWSYCFVWWIGADSKLDAASLKKYMEEYYNGLVSRNITRRNIPESKVVPTVAAFREINEKQKKYYKGTVAMLDYMNQRPMILNISVQIKDCASQKKKAIFFSVSPKPDAHRIWKQFEDVWNGFECKR